MDNLEKLTLLTGESDENLLSLLLSLAESEILSITRRKVITKALEPAVLKWALLAYNRRGMEGESARSEAGISSSFVEIPAELKTIIMNNRIARVGGYAYERKSEENDIT